MADCVFCKIAAGEIPSDKVYEDDEVLAFRDIHPQTPVHILVIPKAHIAAGAADIHAGNAAAVGKCYTAIAEIARRLKLEGGFRIVTNSGGAAGQTVPHLHFHLLAGRDLMLNMG
ncbi:MAG: histidine triad nucleotide-binding protein [Oscillospiraceae bacterium]|jgi:histidine triad (HIT) family protein|nr:histidine triad nucleotide-binding protein [Oscillospiraceae bacterium]